MAKPTVGIRVEEALYDELVEIREARDCTITQALHIYIARERRKNGNITRTESRTKSRPPKGTSTNKKRANKSKAKPKGAILADGKFHKLVEGTTDLYED